jgi:hypothetical protein
MVTKKTVAISFVMVFLALDLAAEVVRVVACQVAPPQSGVTLCAGPAGSASLIWNKATRLLEHLEEPAPAPAPVEPPAPAPAQGETPLERLKQQPKL